jgi:hypothetical protein
VVGPGYGYGTVVAMAPAARREPSPARDDPSLAEVLGGRSGVLDAAGPAVAFVAGWALGDHLAPGSGLWWGSGAACLVAATLAARRVRAGKRPAAALAGLLAVVVAALVALRTGRAADFFLLQIGSNAASALAWTVSILVRWPLLGVVVGLALGQKARWRADPDLNRGYRRASWLWVAQYLSRLAVFIPLYRADQVFALGVARALTWVPVLVCVALSWPLLRSALPPDHPGIRHPRVPGAGPAPDPAAGPAPGGGAGGGGAGRAGEAAAGGDGEATHDGRPLG